MLKQFIKTCCARQHLTPEEWGILEDCLHITSGGKRPFKRDGFYVASRFCDTSKSRVYRAFDRLEDKGWLIRVGGGQWNRKTHQKESTIYHIVHHDEWTKTHTCPITTDGNGTIPTGENNPFPELSKTIPTGGKQTLSKTSCIKKPVETLGTQQPTKPLFSIGAGNLPRSGGVSPSIPTGGNGGLHNTQNDLGKRFNEFIKGAPLETETKT